VCLTIAGYVRGLPYVQNIWAKWQDVQKNGALNGKWDIMETAAVGISTEKWEEGMAAMMSIDDGLGLSPMKCMLLRAIVRLQKPLIARGDDLRGARKSHLFLRNLPGVSSPR
jgi:hypothetical protein